MKRWNTQIGLPRSAAAMIGPLLVELAGYDRKLADALADEANALPVSELDGVVRQALDALNDYTLEAP